MEKNTFKKVASEPRDFRERFEFRLMVNDNIICQRYFKINNVSSVALRSYDLMDTIRFWGDVIDKDLKMKTQIFLEHYAPRIFNTEEEMFNYFANPNNCVGMSLGESILIKDPKAMNYFWGLDNKPKKCENRFEDKELTTPLSDNERVTYKFSFLDNGKEVCATIWEGLYPKMVRNSIDLSNKKFRVETNPNKNIYQMGFEEYIKYKMFEEKPDLIYNIIKEICKVCCMDNNSYKTEISFGKKKNKKNYVNPKLDNESIVKDLTKKFADFDK
jgi:hypothetical protein